MTVRVYRYGCDAPLDHDLVRAQLQAAHDYKNELTAIERGRRDAVRALHDTDVVSDAIDVRKAATKSSRVSALRALHAARRAAQKAATLVDDEGVERPALEVIQERAHRLAKGARELCRCYWGTYLGIEAGAQQARQAPLYDETGLEPANPRFDRWVDSPIEGQIGVQVQGHRRVRDVLAGECNYVRIIRDDRSAKWVTLWIRIGSEGRAPLWARIRMCLHRALPDAGVVKWVRVSVRAEGLREQWSCEITVDDPAPPSRTLDTAREGAIALSWAWDKIDDGSIRVAAYVDTRGARGDIVLPSRLAERIRHPDGIRSVRDIAWNYVQPQIAGAIKRAAQRERLPSWLLQAGATLHLWRSLGRVHELRRRWLREGYDGAREAFELLDGWACGTRLARHGANGDRHLYDYESGERRQLLRQRREWYRLHAAWIARTYRHALLSDHDLSREARWGDESAVRFTAAPDELRSAIRNALGEDAVVAYWDREPEWCERACASYQAGGARGAMFAPPRSKTTNAWAKRKEAKKAKATARKEAANATDSLGDGE